MAWYKQLDNLGKPTGFKRFFTESQEKGLQDIQQKTKRVRWVKTNEPQQEKTEKQIVSKLEKPTKTITLLDVNETNDIQKLNLFLFKTDNERIKKAINEKIISLTKTN
jgi:hypothetical protein